MKAFLIFAFLTILLVPVFLVNVYALGQTGGKAEIEIKPGESLTFLWGIISDKDESITIALSAAGDGAEFFTYPESITLGPKELVYQTYGVTIPDNYPGGITLRPDVYATDFGMDLGSTTINIQMAKTITLNIAPNDDPSLRVDWDALKATQEQEKILPSETVKPVVQQTLEQSPSTTTVIDQQGVPEIQEKSLGSTTVLPSGTEMDPEPKMDFALEDVALQVPTDEGGGCLIATATYGSELAPQVQMLREIRDNMVLQTQSGDSFMAGFNQIYYSFSPTIADWERQNPAFKELVKLTITPLLTSLSILDYIDIETEAQMLGWGLSIIALNLTMYVAVPTLGSYKFSKYLRNRK